MCKILLIAYLIVVDTDGNFHRRIEQFEEPSMEWCLKKKYRLEILGPAPPAVWAGYLCTEEVLV